MTDSKQKVQQRTTHWCDREEYEAPQLRVFGAVGVLTQAGSGNFNEINNMGVCRMGMMSNPMC